MDPEGVREVFLAEVGGGTQYGIREAVRSLPFLARFRRSYFHGVHLPLTYPLPKRLDTALQQFTGMHSYDAIVLCGIDPVIFDADDLLNLCAYVERGGGLMLMGGGHAFSNAERSFGPLEDALPAVPILGAVRREDATIPHEHRKVATPPSVNVQLCDHSPITRGLSSGLGCLQVVHKLDLKPDAQVVAEAGGMPVVVCGTYGAGRIVMVATQPGPPPDNMFFTPAWEELARQMLSWLMRRDGDLVIERADMDRTPLEVGESRRLTLEIAPEAPGPVTARATVSTADEGWLAAGRDPIWGKPQELPAHVEGQRVECELTGESKGLHRVCIEVRGPDWANVREAQIEVRSPGGLKVRTLRGLYVTAPEKQLTFDIAAETAPAPCKFRIVDFDGQEVFKADAQAPGRVDFDVPHLELGHYEAIAERGGEDRLV